MSCLIWLAVLARIVGMYLRTTQRRRKDGSLVRYVQLAHNRRVGGVTQAEVLLNLGREDQVDPGGLRRLAASITRFAGGDGGGMPLPGARPARGSTSSGSRPLGGVWLLDGLWRALGVDRALAGVLGPRRFTTDVERVLFALVANRAIGSVLEARRRGVGLARRSHPGAGGDG